MDQAHTMRAILQPRYGTSATLVVGETAIPTPGPGQILVQVRAAGISRGTIHLLTGLPRVMRPFTGLRRPRRRIPGLDVTGDIVAMGKGVTDFHVGQRVFGIAKGSLAEYAVADAKSLAPAPTGLDDAHVAVLAESGLTALQALDAARVEQGTRLLIIGASGGVGSYAVALAAARGAEVAAVCSGTKVEAVTSWGAQHVIDYQLEDYTTTQHKYDAILDIAGGTPLPQLRQILADDGTAAFVGNETGGPWTGGFEKSLFNAVRMIPKRQRYAVVTARTRREELERLADIIERHNIIPHVHRTYPLDSVPEALDELQSGGACGKIAITV
ncbi:NAD(P)-dependent alcohol dehydrogenase [Rhodococcus sp. BP22]|uniref:NAD(P)-dependent alcohol dehydrogenase n=1 Tax=Rhodococcus sp. BP22 TaxID=2758566 RepID=UPI001647E240|nr:NAD(P)-dependent alcohol dehydrogenase [Rhodococcus sp. BP22]